MRALRAFALALALSLLASWPVPAQLQTGNLFGTIMDEQGNPLGGGESRLPSEALRALQSPETNVEPPLWAKFLERAQGSLLEQRWEEAEDALHLGLGSCSGKEDRRCRRDFQFYLGHLYYHLSLVKPGDRRKHLLDAAEAYEAAAREIPDAADVLEKSALTQHALGFQERAIKLLESAAQRDPVRRYADWVTIGDWLFESDQAEEALGYYERAAALDPLQEEAQHRILRVYRRLSEAKLGDLMEKSRTWDRAGLGVLAREGFENVVVRGFESRSVLAEEALVYWADLQASAGLLTRQSFLRLPSQEEWPSAALDELLGLFTAESPDRTLRWWGESPLRRHTAANVLRVRAGDLAEKNDPDSARAMYEHALDVVPPISEYAPGKLVGRPLLPLQTALDLLLLYRRHPALDPDGESFDRISRSLVEGLAAAGPGGQPEELRLIYRSLGLLYADKGRWTSSGQDNAVWNLEQALALEEKSSPSVREILATGYRQGGAEEKALAESIRTAKEYLDLDDLAGADRVLAAGQGLGSQGEPMERSLETLQRIVQVRNEIPFSTFFPSEGNARLKRVESLLLRTDLKDSAFLRRQRFKILSDLGARAVELGALRDARLLQAEALASCRSQEILPSVGDVLRLEKIRTTILKEGWVNDSLSFAGIASTGEGQTWALSSDELSQPVQVWFSTDLLKAGEVALLLSREVDFAPGAIALWIQNGKVAVLSDRFSTGGGLASGYVLPGATVTLTGSGAPQVQVANAQGEFRFVGLSPGSYQLKAELEGFSTIEYPNITINIGRNTQIEVTLSAAVEDVITVTTESPLLDERRISTGATVSQTELEKIPTARDPWAILQSTPGVLTDRINVGGNESGQQSQYVGPGSTGDQAVWSVDGVVITDMAALGSSPAYYDFDSFEEMQVTTGGSDSEISTGGVILNMVTKRGTNEWRGSGRYFVADDSWQSGLALDPDDLGKAGPWNRGPAFPNGRAQPAFQNGNRIIRSEDYGAEIGGPIVRDRLWVWGSYGMQEVDLLTIADVSDLIELETMNLKLNVQIAPSNSATLFAFNNDKVEKGRNAGPLRPQETTWNQAKLGDDPTAAKVEDTHIFSSNFYLTGLYSIVNGGFELVPQGGLDMATGLDPSGVWHNTFQLYQTERPQEQLKGDASSFFNTGNLSHELKFGASYRTAEVRSLSNFFGGGHYLGNEWNAGPDGGLGVLYLDREGIGHSEQSYTSAYVQDTLSTGNLTINLGLRYDLQESESFAETLRASSLFPNLVSTVRYNGGEAGFEWESIVPRLGLTYSLGAERNTLLRASYSRFADQLGTGVATWTNPVTAYQYAAVYVDQESASGGRIGVGDVLDLNGDGVINNADIAFGGTGFSANFNPNTGGFAISNTVDPNLDPQMTDEILFGVEHALLPEFVLGLNITYRRISDILEADYLVFDDPTGIGSAWDPAFINETGRLHQRSDYEVRTLNRPGGLPNGDSYVRTYYSLRPGVISRGGQHLHNGESEQEYQGASLVFNKRLANRWMLRGNFTVSNWEWSKIDESGIEDPTFFLGAGNREGDLVLQGSGTGTGPKGAVYINSNWSYNLNGLYQIAPDRPWGFNVALGLTGREGYPLPYFERIDFGARGFPGFTRVQVVENPETFRLDDIHLLDAHLEKEFAFSDFGITLGVDVFNVLNTATVLQRQHQLGISTSDHVLEIISPRILRVGARFSFR